MMILFNLPLRINHKVNLKCEIPFTVLVIDRNFIIEK